MNFRLTTILIGSILLLGSVLLIRTFFLDPPLPDTLLVGLGGVKADEIDEVIVERTDPPATLKLKRIGKDEWEIAEPIRAKANSAAVKGVIESLLTAKPTVYSELTNNPAIHGLQPPSLKVTLRKGERSGTLNIGKVTIGGSSAVVFVTTTAKPDRPIAVSRRDLEFLFRQDQIAGGGIAGDLAKWTSDYRTTTVFPSDSRAVGDDVASLHLALPNKKKEVTLTRTQRGEWKFDYPTGWGDADTAGDPATSLGTFNGVRPLLGALTSISAATPADFIDNPKDLKEYGLNADNPDLVKVVLKTRDNQTATVFIGKQEKPAAPPPTIPGHPPTAPPGGKVYVRVEGQPGVIRATASDLSGLVSVIADPTPLRDRTLVNADRAKVDGIDIALAGQPVDKPIKLRRAGLQRGWNLFGGPGDPQPALAASVDKILDVVLAKRSIKDFPAANPANFAAVSATIFLWVDGFMPPQDMKAEPIKRGEPIKIEFGRKEGDAIYVRRTLPGQPPSEFTIATQLKVGAGSETVDALAAVSKTRLDLLDPSLPSFNDATRIAATGANTYTLVRDEKPDPTTKELLWRFDTADARKGQVADGDFVRNQLIYHLANLNTKFGRFVDEQPTPAKLAEYGLSPPRLKVVVDTPPNTEPKQIAIEFGKDTANPEQVYAKLPDKPAVFTLQRTAFDKLVNPDLRDRSLFRALDVAKVDKLEVRGWGDVLGTPFKMTFEKNKDGIWTATMSPPGFVVDPAKVSAFIDIVSRLQAKTFEKGPHEVKHGFADPKQQFEVKLLWPGGSVSMNIAASPDGGNSYYCWSEWLPKSDSVCTIDSTLIKPFKEKPVGLAK